jgi:hypothetical protein
VEAIEQFVSPEGDRSAAKSLFFIFHLLGEWREKSAYRPLARLMQRPTGDIDEIFGGADVDTVHRVMAAVFDGDPQPLYEVIRDPGADEIIRWRMVDALAMVTLNGDLPHDEARRFLRSCFCYIEPQERNAVWDGWQNAIAMLGLAELKPIVKRAFVRDLVSAGSLDYSDFEENLQKGIDDPGAPLRQPHGEYALFGDAIEEFSTWECYRPADPSTNCHGGTASTVRRRKRGMFPALRCNRRPGRLPALTGTLAGMIAAHAAAARNSRNAA